MNIGLIGGGAMGEAIVSAVIKAGVAGPAQTQGLRRQRRTRAPPGRQLQRREWPRARTRQSIDVDFAMLAVKPQDFAKAADAIAGKLERRHGDLDHGRRHDRSS